MRKFVVGTVSITVLLLVAGAVFCYMIDPANIFGSRRFVSEAGRLLLAGETVAFSTNFDERQLQKYLIEEGNEEAECIVLGSSRSMLLRAEMFAGMSFHNYSVSGAGLEDDLALLEIYMEKQGKCPNKIVICLDPFILNAHSGENRWKSIGEYYLAGARRIGYRVKEKTDIDMSKYQQLISWPYLSESWKKYKSINSDSTVLVRAIADEEERLENESGIRPDGSHMAQPKENKKSEEEVEEIARQYVKGKVYQLEEYDELSPDKQKLLEKMVDYLQENGTEVIFYLPPYHPLVYNTLIKSEKYMIIGEAENYFRNLGKEKSIKTYGAYNPEALGITGADFFDGMHMRYELHDIPFHIVQVGN